MSPNLETALNERAVETHNRVTVSRFLEEARAENAQLREALKAAEVELSYPSTTFRQSTIDLVRAALAGSPEAQQVREQNLSVWNDGDGYAVQGEGGQVLAYFALDLSGEGDYEAWNRAQRVRAHRVKDFLCALPAEAAEGGVCNA